jgi:hypothetical protein
MDWSAPVSDDVAARRAGGRRRYNARRAFFAVFRQARVAKLLCKAPPLAHGAQAMIARALGVHRSTITRDVQRLYRLAREGPRTRREQTREARRYALAQLERPDTDAETLPLSPSADGQWMPPDGIDDLFEEGQRELDRLAAALGQPRPPMLQALHELQRLQAGRAGEQLTSPAELDVTVEGGGLPGEMLAGAKRS